MKILGAFKPSKKKIIILVVLIIIILLGYNYFLKPKPPTLEFAEVQRQTIESVVSSSGILTGKEVVNLKFKSSGKIAYMNVKVGDDVLAYQSIAGLDTKLLAIDLQQAQNTLRDKQAAAEKAEDDVKDHSKDESFTQKVTRTTAQAARDSAYDGVKSAQEALNEANLYTPLGGIVTQAPFVAGQNVSAADVIVQIANISTIYFDTEIDEADIGKVQLGQLAKIKLDATPDEGYQGVVDQIIPQTITTESGATVILVRIKLENSPKNFINGLSGESQIIVSRSENTLSIPLEALREDNMVVLQSKQGLKEVKVKSGIQSDTDIEIKEGLAEGEKILINPPANLPNSRKNSVFRLLR